LAEITIYGAPWCPDCRRSKQFLGEQRIDFDWIDIDQDPVAADFVRAKNDGKQIIPTIVFPDGSFMAEPENSEIAQKLGLRLKADRHFYDLLIIGGGPAALTAAIYGAREGIDCLIIERGALGGQAGTTERIDNYPGFPDGVPGAELADRFIRQAERYGVEMLSAVDVTDVRREGDYVIVSTDQGDEYSGLAAIVVTGSTYRKLEVPGEDDLIGAGIHFCATCDGPFYKGAAELMVIGGGNSAAEEALFLTQFADLVRIVHRGDGLRASAVVKEKVTSHPKIAVDLNTKVVEFRRDESGKLGTVLAEAGGETRELHPQAAFIFVGLDPNTGFLAGKIDLDERGFIVTGDDFQTSLVGVFAAGDVRAGSTKQLASATGEGVAALLAIRRYLERVGDLAAHVGD
jgi:thioredoxin reductase (NADPH)